ncbi:MAG: WYL domain-containing transcriptional regulator [Nitrospiraceae bacterium]|nr:MAG: WYL domain-containing transcriptional regulator [Nitrospiraceae bacterium]
MSNKFDSLITILNKLDRNEKVTVYSLINDIEVSERSVHRYLQTLQIAGFPIHYDREKGTYRFVEGFSLKKPNLSVEESLSFALAKNLLKNFGTGIEKGLNSLEQRLDMKETGLPNYLIFKAAQPPALVTGNMSSLQHAITNFKTVAFAYKSVYSSKTISREIDPYYLFYNDDIWYLRGHCHLRNDFRTFALDRISSIKVLNKHFVPVDISPEDELSNSFGSVIDGKPVDVVLRVDAAGKAFITRKKWHQSQKIKELKDGGIEVRFRVNGTEGIKTWIYRWLPHVEVIAPKKLRDTIYTELRGAINKFQ